MELMNGLLGCDEPPHRLLLCRIRLRCHVIFVVLNVLETLVARMERQRRVETVCDDARESKVRNIYTHFPKIDPDDSGFLIPESPINQTRCGFCT